MPLYKTGGPQLGSPEVSVFTVPADAPEAHGTLCWDATTMVMVEVSKNVAEGALFPALQSAPRDARVLANGFSCREQIEQGLGRRTYHVTELLDDALAPANE